MKLENQVTSLEISKRLKELGVKQESYFHWYEASGGWNFMAHDWSEISLSKKGFKQVKDEFSAFTVAELGEMLPVKIVGRFLTLRKDVEDWWYVFYDDNILEFPIDKTVRIEDQAMSTEADARGKMLIYLLENDLLK